MITDRELENMFVVTGLESSKRLWKTAKQLDNQQSLAAFSPLRWTSRSSDGAASFFAFFLLASAVPAGVFWNGLLDVGFKIGVQLQ